MESDTTTGDRRAWLLLALGLVPIIGAIIGSVVFWQSEESKSEGFALQRDGIDITYSSAVLLSHLQSAVHVTERASWPDADPALVSEAEARIQLARDTNSWASVAISDAGDAISAEIGIDPSTFLLVLQQVFDGVEAGLSAQVAGEPPTEQLLAANRTAVGAIEGRSFPAGATADERVRFVEESLLQLVEYQTYLTEIQRQVGAIGRSDASAGVGYSVFVIQAVSDGERERAWDGLDFSIRFLDDFESFGVAGLDAEPVGRVLTDSTTPAEAAAGLQAVADLLQTDSDRLHRLGVDLLADADAEVGRRQRLVLLLGGASGALAAVLLGLTLVEIRHRRSVELAHGEALTRLDDKAQTDPLTGIWNRRRLESRLAAALADAESAGPGIGAAPGTDAAERVMLAYLDLDRFKAINDVYGHSEGDQLLKAMAGRLQRIEFADRPVEVVRFGGDEFVCFVVAPGVDGDDAARFGDRLIQTTRAPFSVAGRVHNLSATVGVAVSEPADTIDSLLLRADTSLVKGKRRQRGTTVSDDAAGQTGEMVKALPGAFENREIVCHFQPVYCMESGKVAHVEALARWYPPGSDPISPADFVPLVEAFGLSWRLTESVLEFIADAVIGESVPPDVRVWVNASPNEFEAFDFAERFLATLDRFELRERVGLEITETAAVGNPEHFITQITEIGAGGVPIAIDDFGNGYSPLGLLSRLDVDTVKLDRTLVADIDRSPGNQSLVSGVIGLLKEQGRSIVAEGVERPEELRWLAERGVDQVQGFLLARPNPIDSVAWDPAPALAGRPTVSEPT